MAAGDGRPGLPAFQLEVARMFFALPASKGFLLAGGAALLAQHLTARPTEDLDFFTAPERGSPVSSLIPKELRNKQASPPEAEGPWLVLNFQDLPKAVGNIKVFGARLDIINWIIAAGELGTGSHIKLLDHGNLGKHVTVRMPDGSQQTWTPAR